MIILFMNVIVLNHNTIVKNKIRYIILKENLLHPRMFSILNTIF